MSKPAERNVHNADTPDFSVPESTSVPATPARHGP